MQCGYAGSEAGSALKTCYDLYYVKHRSLALDYLIVVETLRTLLFDRQWQDHTRQCAFAIPAVGVPLSRSDRETTGFSPLYPVAEKS